jgi:hypothetical protein
MITQARLKNLLHYSPETGVFTWKVNRGNNPCANKPAGCVLRKRNGKQYVSISVDNVDYKAHRLAFLYMNGSFPVAEVDHDNGNGTDNSWGNLHDVSMQNNQKNRRLHANNKSGVSGVHYDKAVKKWRVQIGLNGKRKFVGDFVSKEDAIVARRKAERTYGYHENHGTERPL